jgi:hypothetical protein
MRRDQEYLSRRLDIYSKISAAALLLDTDLVTLDTLPGVYISQRV